jgi:hypothetical protein
MRVFAKYFGVSLAIQTIVITYIVMTLWNYGGAIMEFFKLPGPVLDTAYVVYGIPSIFFSISLNLPGPPKEGSMPLMFFLWLIPALFYSLLIGLAAVLIGKLWRRGA